MAREDEDDFHLLTPAELPDGLRDYFHERFKLETAIAAQIERHVKQLKDDLGALIRKAKAETNINRKILDLKYGEFKLFQESKHFKDDKEGERLREQIRRFSTAMQLLQPGETLNWIDFFYGEVDKVGADKEAVADSATPPAPAKPEKGAAAYENGSSEEPSSSGPKALTGKPAERKSEKTEAPIGPDNSWRKAPDAKDPATMSEAEKAGHYFALGEKAALAGTPMKTAFFEAKIDLRNMLGRSFKSGYVQGQKMREKQLADAAAAPAPQAPADLANEDAAAADDQVSDTPADAGTEEAATVEAGTETVAAETETEDDAGAEGGAQSDEVEALAEEDTGDAEDRAALPDNVVQLSTASASPAAAMQA